METTIQMESRPCGHCGRQYRVMTTSQQKFCNVHCANGFGAPGVHMKPSSVSERKPVLVTLNAVRAKNSENKSASDEKSTGIRTQKKNGNEQGTTMQTTKSNPTSFANNGGRPMLSETEQTKETGITETESLTPQRNELEETPGIQPELLDGSKQTLEKAALDSMRLLQKSGNKLMDLLEASVSDSEIKKSQEEIQKIEAHRIETAIQCANALATTIQTQVNMVKAMSGFMK